MVRFVHLALMLLLATTAQSYARARGQTMAVGEIVLCSGGQAVTQPVDAQGRPTGPAHLCPDMVLSLLAGLGVPLMTWSVRWGRAEPQTPFVALFASLDLPLSPSARGPPAGA